MGTVLLYVNEILTSIFQTLVDASFFLLVGLVCAGIVRAFVRTETIIRHIGQPNMSSVIKASFIGIPLPLCSCSVIPMAVSLYKTGASKGATVSFLISVPETGIDSMAISYAMLDPIMTVFRPIAAFVTAFFAGFLENLNSKNTNNNLLNKDSIKGLSNMSGENAHRDEVGTVFVPSRNLVFRLRDGVFYAFTDLLGDIAYYLLIGLVISGIITVVIPEHFFSSYFHNDTVTMFIMLIIGIPMYVCASASTPIAAALIMKGISPGAALVFLLAGPATNFSTMSIVKNTMGVRSFFTYMLSISLSALLLGFLLNLFYGYFDISMRVSLGNASELISNGIKYASAIIFLPLLLWGLFKEVKGRFFKKPIQG